MGKQLAKMVKEICKEEKIKFISYSNDYILHLEGNKRVMYIMGNKFPNNNASTEQICNDKAALATILNKFNIPHIPHFYFDSPLQTEYCSSNGIWKKLQALMKRYGKLVCKVNRGTGGNHVYKVTNPRELEAAVLEIFKTSRSMAVSPYLDIKNEYRVIVANNEFQYAFQKIRPYIVGNGKSTVFELVNQLTSKSTITITNQIDTQKVPENGEIVELSWKHNLGQGATPSLVRDEKLKFELSDLAKRCVSALQLGFVSIDIVETERGLSVLEINSGVMIEHFSKYSEEYYQLAKEAVRKAIKNFLHLDTKYYLTRTRKSHYVLPVLIKIAKKKKVEIIEDAEEKNFAIFLFPNGNTFVARDYPFNINDGGAVALCSNKNACSGFIRTLGFNTPREKYYVRKPNIQITLNEMEKDLSDAQCNLGFTYPIVVKPNNLSQGEGVFIVHTQDECIRFAQEAFLKSKIVLLQEYCKGNEYRIVVLKDKILQAYQRIAFHITGDGIQTIEQLINEKINSFRSYGRDKEVNPSDPRVIEHIQRAGYTMSTILDNGAKLRLQDIANLSLGGESVDVISNIDRKFRDMAISLARSLNLRLCGIDIIAENISSFEEGYQILEINSSPGLDNYLYEKKKQEKYIEALYGEIFNYLQENQ